MECLGRYTFLVMTSVILSGGVKMRVEHGMLREVYIFCHDFCHTFRWCSRYSAGTISANLADRAGGSEIDPNLVQNRGQMASGGVQVASKVVSKKVAISVLIFGPDFHEFPGPRGGGLRGSNGSQNRARCFWLAGSCLPAPGGPKSTPF